MAQQNATKSDLRERLHALRDAMTPQERQRASDAITVDLLALERYRGARTVMAYMTFGSEFVTGRFIGHALAASKVLVLPRIDRSHGRLELYAVRDLDAELTAGPWGIREPRPDVCPPVAVAQLDFILVPGLGFTPRGDRLGYGRGYYDRLLAQREPHTAVVAAAFAVQMVEAIPVSARDVPVDVVMTEVETYGPKR